MLARMHLGLLWALAGAAALMLPFMVIAVIYDVTLRDTGLPTPSWPDQAVEYAILYLTVLAAPLLTRQRGHVFIGSVRGMVPRPVRGAMDRIASTACAGACGFMSWYLVLYTWHLARAGTPDAKGFDMPRWLIIAPAALAFVLMTVEFLRFTFGAETLHRDGDAAGAAP
jgi:TRAP-type C4-dicarboxylate transport system permease small subunit